MLLKKLTLTPYVVELWIIITNNPTKDIPKLNKKYPGLNITWDADTAAWTNDHFYDGCVLGAAFDYDQIDVDLLAHEAVHITNRTFEYSGYKVDTANDEHQAYFVGWITGSIYKAYEDFKLKQSKLKK